MATASLEMKVSGADRFRALSRQIKTVTRRQELQRKLTKSIRAEGGPALAAVKAAWLTVNVSALPPSARPSRASTGLRARVAAATGIKVQQRGIKISVNGRRVDPKYPSLPFYLNGFPRAKPWRHPVHGNREVWVAQKGQEVFAPTLKEHSKAWWHGCEHAMDEFVDELDRGV